MGVSLLSQWLERLTPTPFQVRESRRPHTHHLALSCVVAEGLHDRQCNFLTVVHLGVCPRFVIELTGLNGKDRYSWYQSKVRVNIKESKIA
ncbi:hypothetical protein Taro_021208 [Colocasia esculenta]|uniref:Uncharacterized protein n=1 Tax=Colocasia esculenta TaxID=4460 RepID=A0A843V4C6_COLES|nr:hypothetical protein [Colocasia esculenta]